MIKIDFSQFVSWISSPDPVNQDNLIASYCIISATEWKELITKIKNENNPVTHNDQ